MALPPKDNKDNRDFKEEIFPSYQRLYISAPSN